MIMKGYRIHGGAGKIETMNILMRYFDTCFYILYINLKKRKKKKVDLIKYTSEEVQNNS